METLFPVEPGYPSGFNYYPAFLTLEEEAELLQHIGLFQLNNMQFQGYEAKRRVASFGYDWSFEKRTLSKGRDIPDLFIPLLNKVAAKLSLENNEIGELLITEYPVGSVINWHRDAPPFDLIAGISLQTDCIFRLRPYEKAKQTRNALIKIPAKRRSLYVMQGEARSEWEHSIAPVSQVRYSITLRTLKL